MLQTWQFEKSVVPAETEKRAELAKKLETYQVSLLAYARAFTEETADDK